MTFEIVNNLVKPATHRSHAGRNAIYPFAKMAVGASFKMVFTSDSKEECEKIARRIRTATLSFRKTHPEFAFETWTAFGTDEQETVEAGGDGLDGVRVRRIEESKREAKAHAAALAAEADALADTTTASVQ